MTAKFLSIGKNKKEPSLNEDSWVVKEDTFAVIDGSGPRVSLKFEGKSGGKFAADIVKEILLTTSSNINGRELVTLITYRFNKRIDEIGARDIIQKTPEGRPAALFTVARIIGDKVVITALGDVGCRINGKIIHRESFRTEELMTVKRIQAMRRAKKQNPDISDEELLKIGRQAIDADLKKQVKKYFNNQDNKLGLGIIDGQKVPGKFIKVYRFDLRKIKSLEIFSDGYFKLPAVAEIESWEQGFFTGEREDPLRWSLYPAVKGAGKDTFSDDRTILIVNPS